jgi:hypothetical protein
MHLYKGEQAKSQSYIREIQECAAGYRNWGAFKMTATWHRIGSAMVAVRMTDRATKKPITVARNIYF